MAPRKKHRFAWPRGSAWLRTVTAERAAEERRRGRAPAARSNEAQNQAITYAEWLMARDGIDLGKMRADFAAALPVVMRKRRGYAFDENASLRDQIARARPAFKVLMVQTDLGPRPRYVEVYEFRGSHPDDLVHVVELPNWAAAWEQVEDLSDEPMRMAA